MFTVVLPNTTDYHDLYALTGYSQGASLIITNCTGHQLRIQPADELDSKIDGYPLWPNHTCLVHGNDDAPVYVKGRTDGYIIVQIITETVVPFTAIDFPQDIVTSGVEQFRRLQVEDKNTGFFEGREFRAIDKIRLSTGNTKVYKFNCTEPFILSDLIFTVSAGNYEVHIWDANNVTEDSAFSTPINIYRKNISAEYRDFDGGRYVSGFTILTGGQITVSDPTSYRDYIEMITAGATAQRVTVGQTTESGRYLPANTTFYLEVFAINGPVRGTVSGSWEERPLGLI